MLLKETLALNFFGLTKIPLLFYTRPRVEALSRERCSVLIPLTRRTRNHLGSMYFGTLAVGADCACGLLALRHIRDSGRQISLIFKDFKADFAKRPEGDVLFTCEAGEAIGRLVQETIATGERRHAPLPLVATVPSRSHEEVARFVLTMSLKLQK